MDKAKHPNIVWLMMDHVAFMHHRSSAGPRPQMPAYERLARQGVAFNEAQSVCPLCQPARASMLTGLYPHHHGMVHNSGFQGTRKDFDADQKLFSHYLRDAGYRTGYFGKWHCGIERTALDYAFEGWTLPDYGHPYNKDAYAEYLERHHLPQATVDLEGSFGREKQGGEVLRLCDEPHEYHHMGSWGVLKTPVETHEAYLVCDMAERWIDEASRSGQPFAVRVDVWGPHQPYWSGGRFAGTVDPRAIPEYVSFGENLANRPRFHRFMRAASHRNGRWDTWPEWQLMVARCYEHVALVDAALGRIIDLLNRLNLAEDTLVIYTADHGDGIACHGGIFDKGSLMVEETMRIPLAMRWPGRIGAGQVARQLVSNMDLVPTVLAAAGVEMPCMDGENLLPIAQDAAKAKGRDDLMCEHYGHGQDCFQRLLRRGPYKYIAHRGDMEELYDLSQDPCELRNLAVDPRSSDILKDMRERLIRQMEAHGDDDEKARDLKRQISG